MMNIDLKYICTLYLEDKDSSQGMKNPVAIQS